MSKIVLDFDQDLSSYFGVPARKEFLLHRRASIKDIVEAHGIPHTEVGSIWVDSSEVGFEHIPASGEKIRVNPVQPPVDVSKPTRLRPVPYPEARFVVDVNAGKLAVLLRMLGRDTLWSNSYKDWEVAALASDEQRIVLSRDRGLLKRKEIVHGRLIRSQDPDDQLLEVVRLFGLDQTGNFSRCLKCNHLLEPVPKSLILHRLKPKTRKYYHYFEICPGCDRIYWQGSHWEKMQERVYSWS